MTLNCLEFVYVAICSKISPRLYLKLIFVSIRYNKDTNISKLKQNIDKKTDKRVSYYPVITGCLVSFVNCFTIDSYSESLSNAKC